MAILSYEDYIAKVQNLIGDRDDEEALSFLEDTRDTLGANPNNNNEDWKKKYEENDATWRKKYRDAFFSAPEPIQTPPIADNNDEGDKILTYEALFKEE